MIGGALIALTFAAAIGSGLVGGIFFAFSSFVMAALGRLPPEQGIAAMQSINVTVLNPAFFMAFFGTGSACVVLAAVSCFRWGQDGTALILLASLTYLVGCVGVTICSNVPLNDALAILDVNSPEAGAVWSRYVTAWTAWNHVRTIAPIVAAILLMRALLEANSE